MGCWLVLGRSSDVARDSKAGRPMGVDLDRQQEPVTTPGTQGGCCLGVEGAEAGHGDR